MVFAVEVPSNEVRISQTEHAITGVIAVAAMAGAAIEALPGVIKHQTEECLLRRVAPEFLWRLACLDQAQGVGLLLKGQFFKGSLINLKTGPAKGGKPQTVALLVTGERTGNLAVNIENHACIRGARSVVTGDDLFADRDEQPGFGFGEESPGGRRRASPMGYAGGGADADSGAEGAHRRQFQHRAS